MSSSFITKIFIAVGQVNRRQILWTILIGFIVAFFDVLGVGAMVPLVSLILDIDSFRMFLNDYSFGIDFSTISDSNLILYVLIFVSLIYVLKFLITYIFIKKQAVLQKDIQIHISDNLLNVYTHMSYSRYLEYNSSKFIRNIQGEIGLLSNTVLLYMNLFSETLMVLGIMSLMLWYDFQSALFLFSFFSIVGFLYYYFMRLKIHLLGKTRFKYSQRRIKVLQDIFNSMKVGRVHDLTQEYAFYYKKNNDSMTIAGAKLKVLSTMPKVLFEFLAVFVILCIVYFQVFSSNSPPDEIITTLALFSVGAIRLIPSSNKILTSIQTIKSTLPGAEELITELAIDTIGDIELNDEPFKSWDKVSINKLSYRYPKVKQDSLSNITLEINSGEVIGIYGQSGSGKSTLIDLIIGLLSPSSGTILIDGLDLSAKPKQWMKCIGYVPQETYLLDSNILHNIVGKDFTTESINNKRLLEALEISGLDSVINQLPQGKMTQVGQGGSSLSGGQKQRVGIARSLYRNPSLLILDEPTSSLDHKSKELFRNLLLNYKDKLTFIIVSHDLQDMDICGKVVQLDGGRIKSIVIK